MNGPYECICDRNLHIMRFVSYYSHALESLNLKDILSFIKDIIEISRKCFVQGLIGHLTVQFITSNHDKNLWEYTY